MNSIAAAHTKGTNGFSAMRMTCRRCASHFFGIILIGVLLSSNCVAKYVEGQLKTLDVRISLQFIIFRRPKFLNLFEFVYRIGHFWQDSVSFRVVGNMNTKLNSIESTANHNCCYTMTIKRSGHQFIKVGKWVRRMLFQVKFAMLINFRWFCHFRRVNKNCRCWALKTIK